MLCCRRQNLTLAVKEKYKKSLLTTNIDELDFQSGGSSTTGYLRLYVSGTSNAIIFRVEGNNFKLCRPVVLNMHVHLLVFPSHGFLFPHVERNQEGGRG